ncbi:MAG: preprotein translocase subunit SecE [Bacillota bacterium]
MNMQANNQGAKVSIGAKIAKYLKDVRIELKKVVWPSRPQLINYTITVLVFCVILGGLIFVIDLPMSELFLKNLTAPSANSTSIDKNVPSQQTNPNITAVTPGKGTTKPSNVKVTPKPSTSKSGK